MTENDFRTIRIFDTTLRDGEQSPGASMNLTEKLEVAKALADLGVDVIEAGFPIASPGDFEAVRAVAEAIQNVTICGLARCREVDIDRAWEALKVAQRPRIHVFLATSAIHRQHKLKMDRQQVIHNAVEGVKRAVGYCDDVEFSPEDASRTEPDFLCEVIEAVIAAGAKTVNIPDTVGYTLPDDFGRTIAMLRDRVPNIDRAVISVHCHNDLGLAVANSLSAVKNGAGQVECTINGIGERAGNAALEEIVMALRTRADSYRCRTGIHTQRLVPTSRLLSEITGLQVQRNKAIVGRNAFAHEAGIHQDGILKERTTYEIMHPEDVGFAKTDLVLGKHSGRAALADRAQAMGYHLTGDQLQTVFEAFKHLADKKKDIYDGDIAALIKKEIHAEETKDVWSMVSYRVNCGTGGKPSIKLTLRRGTEEVTREVTDGDGPVDVAFLAVEAVTGIKLVCKDFQVRSATVGHDAQGETLLELEHNGRTYHGRGVSTDTVEASILGILSVVNRIAAEKEAAR